MTTASQRIALVLIVLMGVSSVFSTVTYAQRMRMTVEEQVKILTDSLKLSDEQVSKITKILEDQREEMTTAMGENRGDREAMRTVMQDLMKKTDEKMKAELTKEQAKKYESMMKARRDRMGQRTKGSGKR